jgi:hypothetical protein
LSGTMRGLNNVRGLVKFGFRLIPNKPWRKSSWQGAREYIRFRNETFSGDPDKYPTLREALRFGGWVHQMDQIKSQEHPLIDEWLKRSGSTRT